ncbi:MAG: hypothetical protein A2163_00735 [Actinobacteria bacterium RBG_13_35_12]|nr:MAG: hypothetical protein A2163_00735 [Actinobacteria bacterium RBG_13_35_12]
MAKIFIGQYHGKSFLSRLIKWRTWSEISHTAAFLPVKNTFGNDCIEAWGNKVRKGSFNKGHTQGTCIDIYSIYCTLKQRDSFYKWLEKHVGDKYDWCALVGFVTRKHIESDKKWFCSELIFKGLEENGIFLLQNIEAYQVSPGQIGTSPILNYETTIHT